MINKPLTTMTYYEDSNMFVDMETWMIYPAEFNGVTQIPVIEEGVDIFTYYDSVLQRSKEILKPLLL